MALVILKLVILLRTHPKKKLKELFETDLCAAAYWSGTFLNKAQEFDPDFAYSKAIQLKIEIDIKFYFHNNFKKIFYIKNLKYQIQLI